MKILSIDSSSITASVSITNGNEVISEEFINNGLTHSQTLMPLVEKALEDGNCKINEMDYFAVTNGPGSFTGVRIGIASVKGMADALNKKCVSVSTLEAIAEPLKNEDVIACSVMDARCNQVYTASFCMGKRLTDDRAILIDELGKDLAKFEKPIILIGDGAKLCYDKLADDNKNISLSNENIRYVHASSIGKIAYKKIINNDIIDADKLVPFYLRLPQAERELNNKKLNNK